MSAIKAEAELSVRSDRFVAGVNQAKDAITNLDRTSDQAGKNIETQNKRSAASFTQIASTSFGAITNIASLGFAYKDLGDRQLTVDRIALQVKKKQEDLNEAMRQGKLSASELANKQEELRLLQEKHKQAIEDTDKAQLQLILNTGTMAFATVPAMITALRGLTVGHAVATGAASTQAAANTGLTLSFRELTAAMLTNPLGIALVAGSIGALAVYETNLFGVKDSVDGLIKSFTGGTKEINDFHSELADGTKTTHGYTSSLMDLNKAYSDTVGNLKKNEDEIKQSYDKTMFLMGSLAQMAIAIEGMDYVGSGFDDPRFQKDTRRLPPILDPFLGPNREANKNYIEALASMRFAQRANLKQNITFGGMNAVTAGILAEYSADINQVFRAFRPYGDSLDAVLPAALRNVMGITQNEFNGLFGNKPASTRPRSGTSKAQSGGFGGYRGSHFNGLADALYYFYGPLSGYAGNPSKAGIQSAISFIESEGVSLPSLPNGAGTYYTNVAPFARAFEAALAEATKRKQFRESHTKELQNLIEDDVFSDAFIQDLINNEVGRTYDTTGFENLTNKLLTSQAAIKYLNGRVPGLEDINIKDLLTDETGKLDYQTLRELDDMLAFQRMDRYSVVGT